MAAKEPYRSFRLSLEQAKATWALAAMMRITRAGRKGDWRADLALLERRLPHYFYRGNGGIPPGSTVDPFAELAVQSGMAALPGSDQIDVDDMENAPGDDMDGRSTEELEHYAATGYWPEEMPRMEGRVVDTDGQDVTDGDAADPATAAELAKQLGDAEAADPHQGGPDDDELRRRVRALTIRKEAPRELPGGELVEDAPQRDESAAPPSNVVRLPRIDPLAGRF